MFFPLTAWKTALYPTLPSLMKIRQEVPGHSGWCQTSAPRVTRSRALAPALWTSPWHAPWLPAPATCVLIHFLAAISFLLANTSSMQFICLLLSIPFSNTFMAYWFWVLSQETSAEDCAGLLRKGFGSCIDMQYHLQVSSNSTCFTSTTCAWQLPGVVHMFEHRIIEPHPQHDSSMKVLKCANQRYPTPHALTDQQLWHGKPQSSRATAWHSMSQRLLPSTAHRPFLGHNTHHVISLEGSTPKAGGWPQTVTLPTVVSKTSSTPLPRAMCYACKAEVTAEHVLPGKNERKAGNNWWWLNKTLHKVTPPARSKRVIFSSPSSAGVIKMQSIQCNLQVTAHSGKRAATRLAVHIYSKPAAVAQVSMRFL